MANAAKAKPKLRITPLEDRVVVVPDEEAETMRGGLYIPDTAKEKPTQGEVIAVGAGRVERGSRVPVDPRGRLEQTTALRRLLPCQYIRYLQQHVG